MPKTGTNKVVCYIVNNDHLVFIHCGVALDKVKGKARREQSSRASHQKCSPLRGNLGDVRSITRAHDTGMANSIAT